MNPSQRYTERVRETNLSQAGGTEEQPHRADIEVREASYSIAIRNAIDLSYNLGSNVESRIWLAWDWGMTVNL